MYWSDEIGVLEDMLAKRGGATGDEFWDTFCSLDAPNYREGCIRRCNPIDPDAPK